MAAATQFLPRRGRGTARSAVEGASRLYPAAGTRQFARKLRREMSLPEVLLWNHLRTRLDGIKFRRQHPVGNYVADFFCAGARLAIEVDGEGHDEPGRFARDRERDAFFAARGIETIRIPARDVLRDAVAVADYVVSVASGRRPLHRAPHGPPPPAGEDVKG